MSLDEKRILVVGGGISGLSAAHRLAVSDTSCEITILEVGDKLGGVLQTEHLDGFCLELGPDSLLSRQPWGVDLGRQVGLSEELISTNPSQRGAHVVHRGSLRRVPDGLAIMAPQRIWPFVTTPILSWRGKLRLATEPWISRRTADDEESLADFSRRRLGREAFERLVQPLASGMFMGDPERLSMQATFPQFAEMESKYGSLLRATRAGRAKQNAARATGSPQYSLFVAPRRGAAQLIEALAAKLSHCRIECGQRVENLVPCDGGWSVQIVDSATGERRHEVFEGAILAAPAHRAASMLDDVEPELSRSLADIPYTGCVVVNLTYERDAITHPLDSFGFVVPHIEKRSVLACTFSSVKYAHRAPDGKALLRVFLGGARFPEVEEWPDQRVLEVATRELGELLGIRSQPLFSRVVRWHRAMPQYEVGHLKRVNRIEQLVGRLPRLELAGNAYRGVGIPHCVHSGQQASDRLVAALDDSRQPQPSPR